MRWAHPTIFQTVFIPVIRPFTIYLLYTIGIAVTNGNYRNRNSPLVGFEPTTCLFVKGLLYPLSYRAIRGLT